MPKQLEEFMLCSKEVHLLVFFSALNKTVALNCNVCCVDDYMYIYELLPHVTPHSTCRTLSTACYKGNRE